MVEEKWKVGEEGAAFKLNGNENEIGKAFSIRETSFFSLFSLSLFFFVSFFSLFSSLPFLFSL